jgi:cell division protein FtsI (penicillin-binding protein 3)
VIARGARLRMGMCGAFLGLLGLGVVRRAVQLQVREAPQLREWAERNYLREIELAPRRGRILDRNGDDLASTVDFDSIYCNPRVLAAEPGAAARLAPALGLPLADVEKVISQPRYFAWLRRRTSPQESAAVMALKLPGVAVRKEPGRVYPKGSLGATVLGHTSVDGAGLEGVELGFDRLLHGNGVQVPSIRDSYGRELLVEGLVDTSAAAGQDLVLSLDKYLSFVTERALAEGVKKHGARAGVAVVMDPRSGEILAMANVPTYDPTDPHEATTRGARDRAVTDQFEPGSVMKTFTFAAALEAHKLRTDELIDCQMGRITIGKHTIHDEHPAGIITAAEVFQRSSNIGAIKIGRRLGRETLYDTLARFGFGRRPLTGLPGETAGMLRPVERWGEIELATAAFGHGLTVTPLQLTTAFAAVAAGGIYHPPRLALRAVQPDGKQEPIEAAAGQRILSAAAARTLLKVMEGVTDTKAAHATGRLAAIDGYRVAGKTGTALKVVNGRYDNTRYMASFVGIVPAEDPRLVIGVTLDEPQPFHTGGMTAAPVWKEIAEAALRYLGVPPSLPIPPKDKDKKAPPMPVAEEVAEGPLLDLPPPVVLGGVENSDDLVAVPSFSGMSLGQAIQAARRVGVDLVPDGSGVAVGQTPDPGPAPRGSVCRVSFRPGG